MSTKKETSIDVENTPAVPGAWYNIILNPRVQNFIMWVIIINALTLGLETSASIRASYGSILHFIDVVALGIYTIELVLKFLALRGRFFRSGWNLFDLFIVIIAYMPAVGPLAVLRSLRILRAMRIISTVPRLRVIVRSLILSLPSIGWVSLLLLVMFYIFSVMATRLFGPTFPEWFGNLGESYYTLFQILTLESWSMGIVRPVMEAFPYAWLFFIPFILLTSFVVLNVFIAVIVGAMSDIREEEKVDAVAIENEQNTPAQQLASEIENLRAQLIRLEALSKSLPK